MKYDGTSKTSRNELGEMVIEKLSDCGFGRLPATREGGELVFARKHHASPEIEVRVYTSVTEDAWGTMHARSTGKDAIRVCAVYTKRDGTTRGVGKETRVNRTGSVDAIVARMHERMRSVYGSIPGTSRCSCCGAPKFTSKKGNEVCAELCWKK